MGAQTLRLILRNDHDDDDGDDDKLSPAAVDILIILLVLVFIAMCLVTILFFYRRVCHNKQNNHLLPVHHRHRDHHHHHHHSLTVTTLPTGEQSISVVQRESLPLPEIRLTFPDDDEDQHQLIVKIGDSGSVGLEPCPPPPPYCEHSLDLDRIGGLKEKDT